MEVLIQKENLLNTKIIRSIVMTSTPANVLLHIISKINKVRVSEWGEFVGCRGAPAVPCRTGRAAAAAPLDTRGARVPCVTFPTATLPYHHSAIVYD